jgi:hypothetical protein
MAIKTRVRLIFERYVVRCGFKIGHQKGDMCSKEIGLCAKNILIISVAVINMIEGGPRVEEFTTNHLRDCVPNPEEYTSVQNFPV